MYQKDQRIAECSKDEGIICSDENLELARVRRYAQQQKLKYLSTATRLSHQMILSKWLQHASLYEVLPISYRHLQEAVAVGKLRFSMEYPSLGWFFDEDRVLSKSHRIEPGCVRKLWSDLGEDIRNGMPSLWRAALSRVVKFSYMHLYREFKGQYGFWPTEEKKRDVIVKWLRNIARFPNHSAVLTYIKLNIQYELNKPENRRLCHHFNLNMRESILYNAIFELFTLSEGEFDIRYEGYELQDDDDGVRLNCYGGDGGSHRLGRIARDSSPLLDQSEVDNAYMVEDKEVQSGQYYVARSKSQIVCIYIQCKDQTRSEHQKRTLEATAISSAFLTAGFNYHQRTRLCYRQDQVEKRCLSHEEEKQLLPRDGRFVALVSRPESATL